MHHSEEDKKALNVDLTQLTLEDFSNNCNICNLKFLTRSSVVYHQKVEHRVGVERTAECEQCHKVMKPANLKNHMTTHQERNFACQLCHTKLSSKSNLKLHFKICTKENILVKKLQYLSPECMNIFSVDLH